ncbi:MAG: SUMF1/EgtB/PvdO family nonheme iron enzyme [Chloroflexota bacterium]|nr:SUMF1/EgtB/PvdO family nonheme iron enzyme [Chloroflexota bacterium]
MTDQVFISYAREDVDFANRLVSDLEKNGINVWIDRSDILPGDKWRQDVVEGIRSADIFLIVLSSKSVQSKYVKRELHAADKHNKPIVPVCYKKVAIPSELEFILSEFHRVTFQHNNYNEKFSELLKACQEHGVHPRSNHESKETSNTKRAFSYSLFAEFLGAIILLSIVILGGVAALIYSGFWEQFILPIAAPAPTITETFSMDVPQTTTPSLAPATATTIPSSTPSPSSTASATATTIPTLTQASEQIPFVDAHNVPMMLIPEGLFVMGSDSGNRDEYPAREVYLPTYYIDQYEVTNAQYAECVKDESCPPPHLTNSHTHYQYYENPIYADYPVIYVKWKSAYDYCRWRDARLPTESEWEKAARGDDERTYPWGENLKNDCSLANYWPIGPCGGDTMKVDSHSRGISPYGVYNMAGNVWEWVSNWYNVYPGGDPEASSDFGLTHRVLRGGSYIDSELNLNTTLRKQFNPLLRGSNIGFRCARDVKP